MTRLSRGYIDTAIGPSAMDSKCFVCFIPVGIDFSDTHPPPCVDLTANVKATDSDPVKYMAASREVRSLLDYAARQSDKLVAYPDLVNATGPDYPEPFYTRILSNNEGEKHQAMVPQGDSAPLGKSSTEGVEIEGK